MTTYSGSAIASNLTARSGMVDLITELRLLTESGTADYSVNAVSYWNDGQLQTVLDKYREDVIFYELEPYPVTGNGGTAEYYRYEIEEYGNFEKTTGGTAVFYLQDGTGATIGTSLYTADYLRGEVVFSSNTQGTSYFVTGRTYDLNAAAADVWRKKASHYHTSFNFSTDNHKVDRNQVYQHCIEMAEQFESMGAQAVVTMEVFRSDTDVIE